MRRLVLVLLLAASALAGTTAAARAEAPSQRGCTPRLLLLAAMPVELDPLLAAADIDESKTVEIHERRFFVGTLRGNNVVLAMTGIGIRNAEETTADALGHFRCGRRSGISGIVFSGVSGGDWIGDVTVVEQWTEAGTTYDVNPEMFAVAEQVAESGTVQLAQDVSPGDPACVCGDPNLITATRLEHTPKFVIGGGGITADPFGGRRLPCAPQGGDVFGCDPCRMKRANPEDVTGFATGIVPFIDPAFFQGYFAEPPAADTTYRAQDMESGAVARVAAAHRRPFLAFRGVSDGQGDPLNLPGFPFQFFAYRQIAADNAAAATLGFLEAWAQRD